MNYRFAIVALAVASLAACGLLPNKTGPSANIVQSSDYCGTPTPSADMHYFASPEPFGAWIEDRDIRELRAAAASLKGVLVVELGQRSSGGYSLEVIGEQTRVANSTLYLAMRWNAPDIDANVAQVIISPCVVIPRPKGKYRRVVLLDQLGEQRGEVTLPTPIE